MRRARFVLLLLGAIIVELFLGGLPALPRLRPAFLWSNEWDPVTEDFGAGVSVYGTVVTAVLAIILAVPVAFGIAFFLTELAPPGCAGRSASRWSCWRRCPPSSTACGASS